MSQTPNPFTQKPMNEIFYADGCVYIPVGGGDFRRVEAGWKPASFDPQSLAGLVTGKFPEVDRALGIDPPANGYPAPENFPLVPA